MWDDEPAPWGDDETPAGDAAPAAAAAADAPVEKFDWKGANLPKADPPEYTTHWVKPLRLNYQYLYYYRENYYDDVIDWMNKRNRGIYRDIPRAEEWAERVIRTYDKYNLNKSIRKSADMNILYGYKPKIHPLHYHTRAYYGYNYRKIL